MNDGTVYIIRQKDTDLYKIGYTRRSVQERLSELQIGSGAILELVHTIPTAAPVRLESYLHEKLTRDIPGRQKKAHGEWFMISEQWLRTIMFELKTRDVYKYDLGVG